MPIFQDIGVLSPTPTYPDDFGNRKRVSRFCRELKARGARIHFIYYPLEMDWRDRCPPAGLEAMRNEWDDFHIVIPTGHIHPSPEDTDHKIDDWWDPALGKFMFWYCNARRLDAFVVHYAYLSRALEFTPKGCKKILDTHDILGDRRLELEKLGIPPEFFHTTVAEENIGLNRADVVLAIKEDEADIFRKRIDREVICLPYYEAPHADFKPRERGENEPLRVGFIGARNNFNRYNLQRFLDVAMPMWADNMAPIEFYIGGTICSEVQHLVHNPQIKLLGWLNDVSEFYEQIDLVLVPMEVSTGQKIKTGEALAYGLPIIAHRHSFEGYPPAHALHQCGSLREIAYAAMELAFDPSGLKKMALATADSNSAQMSRERGALDQIYSHVVEAPVDLIVVDAEELAKSEIFLRHILSVLELTGVVGRPMLYIAGECDRRLAAFVGMAEAWCRIFAESVEDAPELRRVDQLDAPSRLLFEGFKIRRYWAYSDFDAAALARHSIGEAVVPLGFSQSRFVEQADRVTFNGGTPYVIGPLSVSSDGQPVFTPFRTVCSGAFSASFKAPRRPGGFLHRRTPDVWVVASDANLALGKLVAQMAFEEYHCGDVMLVGEGLQPLQTKLKTGGDARLFHASRSEAEGRALNGRAPTLVIDLTRHGDPIATFVQYFAYLGAPVCRPAQMKEHKSEQPRGLTMLDLVELFRARAMGPAALAAFLDETQGRPVEIDLGAVYDAIN